MTRPRSGWKCVALAGLLSLPCAGQETAAPEKLLPDVRLHPSALRTVEDARANLRAVEEQFPGNTREMVEALLFVSTSESLNVKDADDAMELVHQALKVAEAGFGKESYEYAWGLTGEARIYLRKDRPDLARAPAEEAVAIHERVGSAPGELSMARGVLSIVCAKQEDYACAVENNQLAIAEMRTAQGWNRIYLGVELSALVYYLHDVGDLAGSRAAMDEALAIANSEPEGDEQHGMIEDAAGYYFTTTGDIEEAIRHTKKAVDIFAGIYGTESLHVGIGSAHMASLEMRAGKTDEALKDYARMQRLYLKWYGAVNSGTAFADTNYAEALEYLGRDQEALDIALEAHGVLREYSRLAIRLLPEGQALSVSTYAGPAMDTALTVTARRPEMETAEVYQEVVRSRALVAEEMAQREAGLNRKHSLKVEALEKDLEDERRTVMGFQGKEADSNTALALSAATAKMERTERELAEQSAGFRTDERTRSSELGDLRSNMPAQSVLISYVAYNRDASQGRKYDSAHTPSYIAFVMHPDSERIRVFDLGEAEPISKLVSRMRASADAEAHGGGMGSVRNEREYREAGAQLRKLIWDPLKGEMGGANLALVVADGVLNLIPFGALPERKGYMVEQGLVVHMLTSERDLVPDESTEKKTGLLAVGNPSFETARAEAVPAALRDAPVKCDAFAKLDFNPLPGSLKEVRDISSLWVRWDADEPRQLLTGGDATRNKFLEDAPNARILHVATHAFVLDKSCGNGNPLLHSGLVFAGANKNRNTSILTAQQIASLDLRGVDWAVLSACNTGNGELRDGEGVLGLERSFRVAGAKSVVMTLWPVDDDVTRRYMHILYSERFGGHATTANAVWGAARKLLDERRAAGESTHPWYWAGFVGAGGWE